MKRSREEDVASIKRRLKALEEELASAECQESDEPASPSMEDESEEIQAEYLDPEFGGLDQDNIINIEEELDLEDEVKFIKSEDQKTLDPKILSILGDRVVENPRGPEIHPELGHRLNSITRKGLSKEILTNLTKEYPSPGNCDLVSPKLNSEVAAAISHTLQSRDKKIKERQDLMAAALSAVALGLTRVLEDNKPNLNVIKNLTDASKMLAHLFQKESVARRSLLLPALAPAVQTLSRDQPADTFLFGETLCDKVRAAKAVERTARDLKPKNLSASKNSQNPPQMRPRGGDYKERNKGPARGVERKSSNKPQYRARTQQQQRSNPPSFHAKKH